MDEKWTEEEDAKKKSKKAASEEKKRKKELAAKSPLVRALKKQKRADAGEEELQLWNQMARMSVPLFIKYKIDKEPLFDTANTYLDVWKTDEHEKFYGMRHKETTEMHGIVRTVQQNGAIREAQYKKGVLHGLSREILGNSATVAVYREG